MSLKAKILQKIKDAIKVALLFNISLSLVWFLDVKRALTRMKYKDEYSKVKVLVDTVNYRSFGFASSGPQEGVEIYYSRPNGKLTLKDDTNYFFRPRNEKPILVKFSEYYEAHNDSIYIWHHPTLGDLYCEEHQTAFEEKFDWNYISFTIILLLLGVIAFFYILIKVFYILLN